MAAVKHLGGHSDSVLCCECLPAKKLLVSGGEDGLICLADLTAQVPVGRVEQALGDAVTAVCAAPAHDHALYAAAGRGVLALDLRKALDSTAVVGAVSVNVDEVNCLAASGRSGGWLAAGDDAGEVQLISLSSFPGGGGGAGAGSGEGGGAAAARPAYKTLRRGHSNICSCVAFRPHRPWEVLSGGLDACVVHWDFSHLRQLHTWSLAGEAAASGGQVFNPPMVHALAVPQTEDQDLGRLVAAARGDGCIAVYDADARPQAAAGGSGGGKRGGGSGGGKGRSRKAAAAQQSAAAAQAVEAAPGRVCLLGREQGGHTAAVNCVSFLHGSQWQQLLSGGNDCRLLLWNWQWAAEARAEAAEAVAAAHEAADAAPAAMNEPESPAGPVQGGEEAARLMAAEVRHGRKVNWACSFEAVGGANVAVADTSRRLTLLSLH